MIDGTAQFVHGATVLAFGYHVERDASRAEPGKRLASIRPPGVSNMPRGSSSSMTTTTGASRPPTFGTACGSEPVTSALAGDAKRKRTQKSTGAGPAYVANVFTAAVRGVSGACTDHDHDAHEREHQRRQRGSAVDRRHDRERDERTDRRGHRQPPRSARNERDPRDDREQHGGRDEHQRQREQHDFDAAGAVRHEERRVAAQEVEHRLDKGEAAQPEEMKRAQRRLVWHGGPRCRADGNAGAHLNRVQECSRFDRARGSSREEEPTVASVRAESAARSVPRDNSVTVFSPIRVHSARTRIGGRLRVPRFLRLSRIVVLRVRGTSPDKQIRRRCGGWTPPGGPVVLLVLPTA